MSAINSTLIILCLLFPGKNFKSFRPTIQIDNLDNNKNKNTINEENEFLKKKVEELYQETVHLKKNTKNKVIS